MDSEVFAVLKDPICRYAMATVIIISTLLYFTQPYWVPTGVKLIYNDYNAEDVLSENNVPEGVFILSGNYTYISYWINTTAYPCEENNNVKFLVLSVKDKYLPGFKNVVVMDTIEGCGK